MKTKLKTTLALLAAFCGLQLFTATPAMAVTRHTYNWNIANGSFVSGNYLPKDSTVKVFDGVTVNDIKDLKFTGRMGGNWLQISGAKVSNTLQALGYNAAVVDGKLTVQFQVNDSSTIKCAKVEFSNGDDGVYAKVTANAYGSGTLGADMSTLTGGGTPTPYGSDATGSNNAYGIAAILATDGSLDRTISINFGSGQGSVSGNYGIVPSITWNNYEEASFNSSAKAASVSDTSKVSVKWWSHNIHQYTTGVTDAALKGYLDDGDCGDGTGGGAHIGITGIPFAYYDVIVYYATDSGSNQFNPAAFKQWTQSSACGNMSDAYDGSTRAGRSDTSLKFGKSQTATAVIGTNVSYLKRCFNFADFDIKAGGNANSARGGIAAIQIVECNPHTSEMYHNCLSTGNVTIPQTTYGAITTPCEIKATQYTSQTALTLSGSSDEISGNAQYIQGLETDTRTHTVAGWFRCDGLASEKLLYAALAYTGGDHGGYKVTVDANGAINVGKCNHYDWNGDPVKSANGVIAADTWYHIAVSVTKAPDERTATAKVFVNGSEITFPTTTFGSNLAGNSKTIELSIGAGVSAAGIYADFSAIADAAVVRSVATDPKYVRANLTGAARIQNTGYETVAAAFAAVQDGQTVVLLAACTETLTAPAKTFTLDLGGFAMSGSLATVNNSNITLVYNGGTFTPSVTGGGTIVLPNNTLPTGAFQTSLKAANWTGTVWIKNMTWNGFKFADYGNASSKVKLTGISGYATNSNTGFDGTVILADDGNTVALNITDGYTGFTYYVAKLEGDGTFKFSNTKNATHQYRFKDASGFTGTFNTSATVNRRIVIGAGTTDADTGCILIEPGATATIASGKTWTVASTKNFQINGTLINDGTISGTIKGTGTIVYRAATTATGVDFDPATTLANFTGTMQVSRGRYKIDGKTFPCASKVTNGGQFYLVNAVNLGTTGLTASGNGWTGDTGAAGSYQCAVRLENGSTVTGSLTLANEGDYDYVNIGVNSGTGTFNGTLLGSTKMRVKGSGTLNMSGATLSGSNPIELLSGSTLKIPAGQATGDVTVNSGATLDVIGTDGQEVYVITSGAFTNNGTVKLNGAALSGYEVKGNKIIKHYDPRTVYAKADTTEFTDETTVTTEKGSGDEVTLRNNDTLVIWNGQTVKFNQTAVLAGYEINTDSATAEVKVQNGTDGYTFNGEAVTVTSGKLMLHLEGGTNPKIKDSTITIGANGNLTNYGWPQIDGTLTINNETDKTVFDGNNPALDGSGNIVKTGAGKLTMGARPQGQAFTISAGTLSIIHYNADSAIGAVDGAGTLEIASGAVVAVGSTISTTVTGAGMLVYDHATISTFPATAPTGLSAAAWTGTVWFRGYTDGGDRTVAGFRNAGSTIKFTSMKGYFANNSVFSTLELENSGDTPAFECSNGYGGWDGTKWVVVTNLTGTGTLKVSWTGGQNKGFPLTLVNLSNFHGSLWASAANGIGIFIGPKLSTWAQTDNGKIVLVADGTAAIAEGKSWTAVDGIVINGAISGAGTLASATTFGEGAEIATTNGTLIATGDLTFNETSTKIRVATLPAAGDLVKVIEKAYAEIGDITTTVSLYVGDSPTPATELGYDLKLVKKSDGVYLNAISGAIDPALFPMTATMDAAGPTEWDSLPWQDKSGNAYTAGFNHRDATAGTLTLTHGTDVASVVGATSYRLNLGTLNIVNQRSTAFEIEDEYAAAKWSPEYESLAGYIVATTIDDSQSTGRTELSVNLSVGNLIAGADTVIDYGGTGTLTVGVGKKATLGAADTSHPATMTSYSNVADGTIRFEGTRGEVAFADYMPTAGNYEFKNATVAGDMKKADSFVERKLVVREGDAVTLSPTPTASGGYYCADVSVDVKGGSLTYAPTANTWFASAITFSQSGGLITFNASGDGTAIAKSVIFGYTGSPFNLNISGGATDISKTMVYFDQTANVNLSGTGVLRAKGLKRGGSGTITITVADTSALSVGSYNFAANTATLNLNGGKIQAFEDSTVANAITVNSASTISAAAGKTMTVTGAVSGTAALTIGTAEDTGTVVMPTYEGPVTVKAGVTYKIQLTQQQMIDGYTANVTFESGSGAVTFIKADGTEVAGTGAGGNVFKPEIPTGLFKYGYAFNGDVAAETGTSASLSFNTQGLGGLYEAGVNDPEKAMTFKNGKNYGNGFGFGGGDFTVVAVVKAPTTEKTCIFGLGGGNVTGLLGMRRATGNNIAVFTGSKTDLITVEVPDATTKYHTYVIRYNNTTHKLALSVDGGAFSDEVAYTSNSNANFQFGGINGGQISDYAINADDGAIDEFRLYTAKLSLEVLKPIIAPFFTELKATIADSATGTLNMSELGWTPPIYTEAAAGGKNWTITDNAADVTAVFDTAFSAAKFTVTSGSGKVLTLKNGATTPTISAWDLSGAADGVAFDATTALTVDQTLRNYLRDTNVKAIFKGSGETGATLDYGSLDDTFQGHVVFDGGKHAFVWRGSSGGTDFGANATAANPTILVKSNTTLDFTGKDVCGYTGTANVNGIIEVQDDGILNFITWSNNTLFYRQRITLNPGATMTIGGKDGNFCMIGGCDNANVAQLYMPDSTIGSDPAVISGYKILMHDQTTSGVAASIGANSTLDIQSKLAGAKEFKKYGAGTLKISATLSDYTSKLSTMGGTTVLACGGAIAVRQYVASGATLDFGSTTDTTMSGQLDGSGVLTKTGTGALTISGVFNMPNGTLRIPTGQIIAVGSAFAGDTFTVGTLDNLGTLDLSATSVSKLALTDVTNLGTIIWPTSVTGEIVLSGGTSRDFTTVTAKFSEYSGALSYAVTETPAEYGKGNLSATGMKVGATLKVTRPDGSTYSETVPEGGTVTVDKPVVVGMQATLYDISFTNRNDIGKYAGTFTYKRPANGNLKYDNKAEFVNMPEEGEPTKDTGLCLKCAPYIDGANAEFNGMTDFTTVVIGKMSATNNTIFVHFGSDYNNGSKGVLFATTEKKDEVVALFNVKSELTKIATLSVPNSASARHVYAITKVDSGDNSLLTVYVDGKKRGGATVDKFSLGVPGHAGVQVGADFGGTIRTGTYKAVATNDTTGVINVLRVYDYVLSTDQLDQLSKDYEYKTLGGTFTRTFTGEENLSAANTWTKDEETTPAYALPVPTIVEGVQYDPSANITADGADVIINVNANLTLDMLKCLGDAMTFRPNGGSINVTGDATINTPVTIINDSLSLSTCPVYLGNDGHLTIDWSNYDVSSVVEETPIAVVKMDRDDSKITFTQPTALTHTYNFAYSDSLGKYVLTVTPNHTAGEIFYISGNFASDGNLVYHLADGTPATLLPGDTVVISNTMTSVDSATIASTSPVTQYKFAKDFTLSASSAEAVLGSATVTTLAETTLTLKAANDIAMNIAATTLNGGTVKLDGVTVAGNVGGNSAVVVEAEKSVTANANISAPVSGAGTITIASTLPSLNLQANTWTGTVVIPEIEGKGINLNNWGKTGSTIQIGGITDGWLAQGSGAKSVVSPALTMNGVFFITAMSPWDYTLAKVSGSGPISFSTSNEQPKSITLSDVTDYTGVVTNLTTATLYVGGTVSATAKFMVDGRGSFDFTAATLTDGATYAFDITKIQEGDRPFNFSSSQSMKYKSVTVIGTSETLMYDTSTGTVVAKPTGGLTGLHIVNMMPKPTSRIEDRDPNGRESGWIRLYNYGPEEVNLKDYKIVRTNLGKEYKTNVSNLVDRAVAANEFAIVYTSEDYPTAEDYGGNGKRVATYAKNGEGKVVEDPNGIIIVPTKVNPKKYPMVRLVKGKDIIDEIIVPCDIDDNMQIEVVPNATKLERKVVYVDGTKAEYGPGVNSLYGIDGVKGDLKLLNKAKFAKVNTDYTVVLPVNPFRTGTNDVLEANSITNVVLEYRVFDPDTMTTNVVEGLTQSVADTAKLAETYGTNCCLYTGTIPAAAMQAGKLVQFRAKIFDKGGKTWTAPSFLNPDIGYEWYGVVAQPETTSDPLETSKVCTDRLQTFLMFGERVVVGTDNMGGMMDKDIDDKTMTLPYGARVGIYDIENKTYYDNVRIDLRGQTSKTFYKKSHGLRFNKVAPLKIANPFTGEEYETRKTSFIAEYGDPMYLRQTLALQVMRTAGVKAPFDWPVRVYCNGTYYQLAFHSSRFSDEAVTDFYGLNAYGYSYKNVEQMLTSNNAAEKKTPDDDNEKDLTVLREYQQRVATTDATALTSEAKLRFNIPAWINYLAATRVTQEADDVWTNLGIYINKYDYFHNPNGDDTIMPLAYDQNLSFGQWYYADDSGRGRSGIVANVDTMKSHPFYGGEAIRYTDSSLVADRYNRAMNAILTNEKYREALARRLRTLMDVYFGSLNASKEDTPIWDWVVSYTNAISGDVAVDHQVWKYKEQYLTAGNIWVWNSALDFGPAIDDLWDNYIVPRRQHLYGTHSITNTAKEIGYGPTLNAGIPDVQTATATLASGISITKSDGTKIITGQTTVTDGIVGIENTNAEAIDMSYWKIDGVATHIFAPGTVLPAGTQQNPGKLWIVLDRRAAETQTAIAGANTPMIVNVDRDAKETISGEAKISLVDAEGTTVATSQFYMTVGTDPESGKVVAVVTYSDPGTSQTTLPMDWMVEHGIDTTGNEYQLSTNMNVKIEGGNGATPWESYALGLAPEDSESKPVIAPVQTKDAEHVTFKLTNVDGAGAATKNFTVTYKVKAGTTPGGSEIGTSEAVGYDATQSMELPTDGVRYYTLEVITTPAK